MRNLLPFLLLGGVAAAAPASRVIHNADGSLVAGGKSYASQTAYFQSDEWKASGGRCGTVALTRNEIAAVEAQTDCNDVGTKINSDYTDGKTYVIQVVMHVVQNAAGTGNISDDQVKSQIQILNEDYQALANSHGAPGNNASIKFVLARYDAAGAPTTGIERVTNDAYFNECDTPGSPMKTALHWDSLKYLNLYSIDLASCPRSLLGYATFPWEREAEPNIDGVVLAYQSVGNNPAFAPYDLGASATHEIGHWLGMYHTFENYLDNTSCGKANAPYTSGDTIKDTVAEAAPHYSGCTPVDNGCTGTLNGKAPIENYMDYSDDACMTTFTVEQENRMRCVLTHYRTINTQPTAAFTSTVDHLSVKFASTATDAESQATALHHNWDFGDGMTSTDQNPTHAYATAGSYDVTLEVVDPMSAAGSVKQSVTAVAAGGTGADAGTDPMGGGDDDGSNNSSGGGCCQAPKGGLSFVLTAIPVGFVLLRRRRR